MEVSSAFLIPVCNSVNTGSTRVCMTTNLPSAAAAFSRTARLGSLRALMKVVCSWGRKAFNMAPHLPNNSPRVSNTATLTLNEKRSLRIRMRGPVMLMTDGLRASALVRLMTSPSPIAADSFSSGVPSRRPLRKMGQIGAMPFLSRQKPGSSSPLKSLTAKRSACRRLLMWASISDVSIFWIN